jgi:hypothetical protein
MAAAKCESASVSDRTKGDDQIIKLRSVEGNIYNIERRYIRLLCVTIQLFIEPELLSEDEEPFQVPISSEILDICVDWMVQEKYKNIPHIGYPEWLYKEGQSNHQTDENEEGSYIEVFPDCAHMIPLSKGEEYWLKKHNFDYFNKEGLVGEEKVKQTDIQIKFAKLVKAVLFLDIKSLLILLARLQAITIDTLINYGYNGRLLKVFSDTLELFDFKNDMTDEERAEIAKQNEFAQFLEI